MSDPAPEQAPLTRAQLRAAQARAAGTPVPVIPPVPFRPLVTVGVVALSALLAISAYAGPQLVAVSVALGGGVLAWGWAGLLGLPSPRGTGAVLLGGTVALCLTTVLTSTDPFLRWVPAAFAVSLIGAFAHQLARRDGRPRLVESVASTTTGLAVIASGAALVPLPRTFGGNDVVAIAVAAVVVSAVTDLAGRWERMSAWLLPLAMAAGAVVAVAVSAPGDQLTWGPAALLGLAAAGVSHAVRRVLSVLPAMTGARPQLVAASASVLSCGVVVYVVSRIFVA